MLYSFNDYHVNYIIAPDTQITSPRLNESYELYTWNCYFTLFNKNLIKIIMSKNHESLFHKIILHDTHSFFSYLDPTQKINLTRKKKYSVQAIDPKHNYVD